ncbi:MAG: geranylgeranylglycerol-phosphate geranylgeranyltransferase [Bacteroidales bacterium]
MNKALSYARLYRWQNLLIIALILYLFRYAIVLPSFGHYAGVPQLSSFDFFLLVLVTLGISAAGYAINDYFDIRTDRINKPHKIVLGKALGRRHAIFSHKLLNAFALVLALWLCYRIQHWPLVIWLVVIQAILWWYSLRLKRRLLSGNLAVALLAALPIILVWYVEYHAAGGVAALPPGLIAAVNRPALFYALFAFLSTMVREVLKDMEDLEGDRQTGCETIPVVMGMPAARQAVTALLLLLVASLAVFQVFFFASGQRLLALYLIALVQLPALVLIPATWRVNGEAGFGHLQLVAKLIMLAGVVSMMLW